MRVDEVLYFVIRDCLGSVAATTGSNGTLTSQQRYPSTGSGQAGTAIKYYSFAGQTVAMRDGDGLQYLLTDHLGSVVAITDASGTLTSQQRFLPFGQARTDIGAISQTDLGYTGQRSLDDAMGRLMDYKARFYDPYLNRFIQPDTIVPNSSNSQSLNRYAYVLNNPILFNVILTTSPNLTPLYQTRKTLKLGIDMPTH
jgi:RHS repeat-associated protein